MSKDVTIEKLDHFGRGIFFDDNKICFVPFTLPNEVVNVSLEKETSKYKLFKLNNIIEKSNRRVSSDCPYYGICGGCNIRHMSYKDTINYKLNKVKELFHKFKINYDDISIIENPNPKYYRNKIELKCLNDRIGFYKNNSHELVEINECILASKCINDLIGELKSIKIPDSDIIIRSNYNNELLIWFKTKSKISIDRGMFSKKLKIASILVNEEVIYGEDHLIMKIDNKLFKCSYDAFFQVNSYITEMIANYLKSCIESESVIVDLYCGVGFLGVIAGSKAKKVYGIEIVDNAIENAIINAKINKLDNMYFMLGDASEVFNKINDKIDYLIIDPPRSGLDKNIINTIIENKIDNIFYMSCDPNTLARDLFLLQEHYNIKKVTCFDMFSYTYHCEVVTILERR